MPIPIYTDLAAAQASVLKRVPFDEVEVTEALLDNIAARVGACHRGWLLAETKANL